MEQVARIDADSNGLKTRTTTSPSGALTSGVTHSKSWPQDKRASGVKLVQMPNMEVNSGVFKTTKVPFADRNKPMTDQSINHIHVGIGGWTFAPWRGVFYPKGLPQAQELSYAANHLTSIEINGTFYRTQTPATFRKWASEVPDGFVFAVKGHQRVTHRRELKDARESIDHFLNSGVLELGDRLGPLLWQFPPYKKFDASDFGSFLEQLPKEFGGRQLRHVVEVRHNSFLVPEFVHLLRQFETAVVFSEHETYPPSRRDRGLSVPASAKGRRFRQNRLSAESDRRVGCTPEILARRPHSRRPAPSRKDEVEDKAAGYFRLLHP